MLLCFVLVVAEVYLKHTMAVAVPSKWIAGVFSWFTQTKNFFICCLFIYFFMFLLGEKIKRVNKGKRKSEWSVAGLLIYLNEQFLSCLLWIKDTVF